MTAQNADRTPRTPPYGETSVGVRAHKKPGSALGNPWFMRVVIPPKDLSYGQNKVKSMTKRTRAVSQLWVALLTGALSVLLVSGTVWAQAPKYRRQTKIKKISVKQTSRTKKIKPKKRKHPIVSVNGVSSGKRENDKV